MSRAGLNQEHKLIRSWRADCVWELEEPIRLLEGKIGVLTILKCVRVGFNTRTILDLFVMNIPPRLALCWFRPRRQAPYCTHRASHGACDVHDKRIAGLSARLGDWPELLSLTVKVSYL